RLRPPQGSLRHADRARRGAGEPPLIPADPCPGRTRAAYEVPGNPVKMAEMARPKPPGEPEEGPECPGVEANATPVFPVFVRKKAQFAPKRGIITMRRTVLMGLAVLSAAAMPLAASAGPGALSASGPATAAQASSFTLGGAKCSLIKVPAAGTMPVGVGSCPGVRPGAEVQTEVGLCTLNFLFEAPDHERFVGTAGHCIMGDGPVADNAGEKTWPKGGGPVAKDSTGHRIGEFAYAILQDPKDFSLIRLDSGVESSPEMCQFGGPTGINSDVAGGTKVLEYWGNGIGIGSTVPARSAVADGFPNP